MNDIDILKFSPEFRYQLLDRMVSDCKYYLGYGNRHPKYLWAGNEEDQIKLMKSLWDSFPVDQKPEWLTWGDILEYESLIVRH